MSLMKLLSVSKSFAGGKSQPGRYKLAGQAALPKFTPSAQPVSGAPKREPGKSNPKRPLPTELSLAAVKPVRNDLSDADLEVVPANPQLKPAGAQKSSWQRWLKPELTGMAWNRMRARLFHSGRARV